MNIYEEIWVISAIVAIYAVPTVVILYNTILYYRRVGAK
jgi:hypothetical protein